MSIIDNSRERNADFPRGITTINLALEESILLNLRSLLSCLILFGMLLAPFAGASESQDISQGSQKIPEWLSSNEQCPAVIIPRHETEIRYLAEKCQPDRHLCLTKCKNNDGNACYALALALQGSEAEQAYSEALFQRSCQLGVTSGCTNRAAGLMHSAQGDEKTLACASRTFKLACARDDPWACTMYALTLARGMGVKQDLSLALAALKKSCKFGPKDPACKNASALENEIKQALKNAEKEK